MRFDLISGLDGKGLLSVNIQPFAVIPSGFNIRNRRFLTFYFLIYTGPNAIISLTAALFLTVYFLICLDPQETTLPTQIWFPTFFFLINANIPSLP